MHLHARRLVFTRVTAWSSRVLPHLHTRARLIFRVAAPPPPLLYAPPI
jgi:hypothetical protein